MSRLEMDLQNVQNYLKAVPVSGLYTDKDGYQYWYTIWHLEQLIK